MPTTTETKQNNKGKVHPLLSTPNILSILGLAIALIYGWIGFHANERMEQLSQDQLKLSKKQDSTSIDLTNFRVLLGKTDTVISELNNQLSLLRQQQRVSNLNTELSNISNENNFFFSVQSIQSSIINLTSYSNLKYNPLWERLHLVRHVDSVLSSQLDNPFLSNNKYILKDWVATHDTLLNFQLNTKMAQFFSDSLIRRDTAWFHTFFSILKLSNHIARYKKYYLKNKGHIKPEDYLKINASKKF